MERVHKAATNPVPKLRKFSYPDRLKKLGITSLNERRLSADTIEVYKLLSGKEHIGLAVWYSGNALVSINAVALHRARLVLGWVTAFGQVNCLITKPATQDNSAFHPSGVRKQL